MTRTKFTRTLNTDVSSASDDPVSRGNSTAGELDRILAMTPEQLRQSFIDEGEDPDVVAATVRDIIQRTIQEHRK